jgi:hypothetical protein
MHAVKNLITFDGVVPISSSQLLPMSLSEPQQVAPLPLTHQLPYFQIQCWVATSSVSLPAAV